MKKYVKKISKKIIQRILNPIVQEIHKTNELTSKQMNTQIEQRRLFLYYKQLLAEKKSLPDIHDTGFRVFSQNDEDGILLYLFALLGTTNKKCVDIAFASPDGANTTNLICNFGWTGLLVCGGKDEATRSNNFFKTHPDSFIFPPKVVNEWITAENVNTIIAENGFGGEVDLLSLDMDGVDYWVWKNINIIQPRVVVVEFQQFLGSKKSYTVPYKPDFNRFDFNEDFYGASLPAFVKLAKAKGYRLVGCNNYRFNAFFIKDELAKDILPEVSIEKCFSHPMAVDSEKNRFSKVKDMNWMEV